MLAPARVKRSDDPDTCATELRRELVPNLTPVAEQA
jgi:hypothetical protein